MKLISLSLHNFRQYRDTSIDFFDGITGIVGTNGAGKTTLLEAIAWTLYGTKALQRMDRGKADSIRSRGASSKDHTECTLDFALGGQRYSVIRRQTDAALFCGDTKLHTGTDNVTRAVTALLRMDPSAFFTSFFTGQKDLAFLRDVAGQSREAYVGRLLGFGRLTKARDLANEEKRAVKRDLDLLEHNLPDPEDLKRRKREASASLKQAEKELLEAVRGLAEGDAVIRELQPQLLASQKAEKTYESLNREVAISRSRLESEQKQGQERRQELQALDKAAEELQELLPRAAEFDRLKMRKEELTELRVHHKERENCERDLARLQAEMEEAGKRLKVLQDEAAQCEPLETQLGEKEELHQEAEAAAAKAKSDWTSQRLTLQAELKGIEERRREVEEHLRQVQDAGPEGVCPTCERPLQAEYGKVVHDLRQEEAAHREAAEAKQSLLQQLGAAPAGLPELEARVREVQAAVTQTREKLFSSKRALEEAGRSQETRQRIQARMDECRARQAALPTGFDEAEWNHIMERGGQLKPVRDRVTQLTVMVARRAEVQTALERHQSQQEEIQKDLTDCEKQLAELNFQPDQHEALVLKHREAEQEANKARERTARLEGQVQTCEAVLKGVERDEQRFHEQSAQLDQKRAEHRHLEFLTAAFDDFRRDLNAQIRPRLASEASRLLSEITDSRYNEVDLDENYTPMLYDDGEYKPVISGGEEDVVHLSLRLAVSQMIAERAGVDLGLLVLDEVFGSLDEHRRESVISLLQNLKGTFQQILLITHIESIHDMVDRCVWVDYDRARQQSFVRDARSAELPEAPENVDRQPALALEDV